MLGSQLSSQPEDYSPEAAQLPRSWHGHLAACWKLAWKSRGAQPAGTAKRCAQSTEGRAATYIAVQEEEGFRAVRDVQHAHTELVLVWFMHIFKGMSAILKFCHQKQ